MPRICVREQHVVLEIELEAAPVEVRGADQPDLTIDDHRFRVQQPAGYSYSFTPAPISS